MNKPPVPIVSVPTDYLRPEYSIGKGRFGSVYKINHGELDSDYQLYAAKHCRFDVEGGENTFDRELDVLSRVKCPYIVTLHAIYQFNNGKGLILEYSERSLGSFLHDKPCNLENEKFYHLGHVVRWMKCAAEGLRYIHSLDIIHRDIKPDNCLLFDNALHLKLADFGVTRHESISMTSMAGTVIWMAPEVANSTNYTKAVDTYSWAIMFWECLTRKLPYFNCRYIIDAEEKSELTPYRVLLMKQHKSPLPIEGLPFPFGPFLDECWSKEANERPHMNDIVKIMHQIEICCPKPTLIRLRKTEIQYAATVTTIEKSASTVKRLHNEQNIINEEPKVKTKSAVPRRTHSRSHSAGPEEIDAMIKDRLVKSTEELEYSRPPQLRRELSSCSDLVFYPVRRRSTDFDGCSTPIISLISGTLGLLDFGDKKKVQNVVPRPDPVCPASKELYAEANRLLGERENTYNILTSKNGELATNEETLKRETERCKSLQYYLTNRRLKKEHTVNLTLPSDIT